MLQARMQSWGHGMSSRFSLVIGNRLPADQLDGPVCQRDDALAEAFIRAYRDLRLRNPNEVTDVVRLEFDGFRDVGQRLLVVAKVEMNHSPELVHVPPTHFACR